MQLTEMAQKLTPVVSVSACVDTSFPEFHLRPIDYQPIDGDYGMNWCGPPRQNLDWSCVEFYKPIVELKSSARCDVYFVIVIREDVSWWFDNELGLFSVTIRQGNKVPKDEDIICRATCSINAPQNSPDCSTGSFWLGCTKKGKVRGNEGKSDGRSADVFIEISSYLFEWGGVRYIEMDDNKQSPRHTIRCN
jgi:hypothetical protein